MFIRRSPSALMMLAVVSAVLASTLSARAGTSDVAKHVPDSAWGFLVVKSLKNVDDKAVQLKNLLGLDYPTPVTPMALSGLKLGDTLDMNQPMCAIMMDANKYGGPQNAAVLLVPATDPKGLIAKLKAPEGDEEDDDVASDGGSGSMEKLASGPDDEGEGDDKKPSAEKKDSDLTECLVMGEPAFAAIRDKYVVLGPSEDCVKAVAKAKSFMDKSFDDARRAAIDRSDFFISISLRAVMTAYKDMIQQFMPMFTAADASGNTAKQMEALIKMLQEMSSVDIAIALDDAGFRLSFLSTAHKESDLEKLYKDTKTSKDSLIKSLPSENYILAMGGTGGFSEHSEKFGQQNSIGSLLQMAQIEGFDKDIAKAIDKEVAALAKGAGAWAFSISAPDGGDDGLIGLTAIIESKDASEYIAGMRKIYEAIWKISEDEDMAAFKKVIVHTPDAETIDGNKIDTIKIAFDELPEDMAVPSEELAKVSKILGKDFLLRFGPAGDKHIVMTLGGGAARFEAACKSLKGGSNLSSDSGITEASKLLPGPRNTEGYVSVDGIYKAIKSIAKAVEEDEPIPFELPTMGVPLAFCGTMSGATGSFEICIPMKLIKGFKAAYDKYEAQGMSFDEDEDGEDGDKADADDDMDDADEPGDSDSEDDEEDSDDDEDDGGDEDDDDSAA